VQDADEAVAELAEGGLVTDPARAERPVVACSATTPSSAPSRLCTRSKPGGAAVRRTRRRRDDRPPVVADAMMALADFVDRLP
jgi:hypothetical protein